MWDGAGTVIVTKHVSDQRVLGEGGRHSGVQAGFQIHAAEVWGKSGLGETTGCAEALGEETIPRCWFILQLLLSCFVLLSDSLVHEANICDGVEHSSRVGNLPLRVLGFIFPYWGED